ncbi:MAG: hydroxymethylbilane synthase [Gemmatimonadetes bacterium]|nr:hydroxymethylbilane synthase [Gemmatimonadota bacterium]
MVRVGTRASALARRQAELVVAALCAAHPDLACEIATVTTRGDRDLESPLPAIGGKGVFTAELEEALRRGTVTIAVHSLKDLPTEEPPGLVVAAVLERADPRDVLVSRSRGTLAELPTAPAVGTSSLRRAAQVLALRPDARLLPLRGNVETRVRKAMDGLGPYDAIVLAAAGLERLGLADVAAERFAPDRFLPAPGQGAVAIECRRTEPLLDLLRAVSHPPTWSAVTAERAFLSGLGAGCTAPVAAFGREESGRLILDGLVASQDGRRVVRVRAQGDPSEPAVLGARLAADAREAGAEALLAAGGGS